MPSLHYLLHQADLGLLRIFADVWQVEALPSKTPDAAKTLESALQAPAQVEAVLARLPDDARAALATLNAGQGKMPWADAVRRFGPFREMGPGKRDREKPHLHPVSPLEVLWYAALVGRAFLPTPRGPVEFAYVPDELRPLLPADAAPADDAPPSRPASREEAAFPLPVNDHILDHLTTYLAARRANRLCDHAPDRRAWRYTPDHLEALARALGVISPRGESVVTDAARTFLESDRGTALLRLFHAWRHGTFNDLKLVPALVAEGTWENDPRRAREAVLGWLAALPENQWWSLSGLVAAVQQCCPDFQRPAPGDYDSWYLRAADTGENLQGWAHWDAVDGALIRFIITGPLRWFGAVALAAPEKGAAPAAFRLTAWGRALLNDRAPAGLDAEDQPLILRSDGRIAASWHTPRVVRYHIARFADWEGTDRSGYRFRLSARALARAEQQGIAPRQILGLLEAHSRAVPPSLRRAVRRWAEHGAQATFRTMTVLQVRDPAMLQALRESRAARFLGPVLGATAVAVADEAVPQVLAALAEMGYFAEISD